MIFFYFWDLETAFWKENFSLFFSIRDFTTTDTYTHLKDTRQQLSDSLTSHSQIIIRSPVCGFLHIFIDIY